MLEGNSMFSSIKEFRVRVHFMCSIKEFNIHRSAKQDDAQEAYNAAGGAVSATT
jgi:hypothetical protein